MHLVQVGHRVISLEHLVMAEDSEYEPAPKNLPPGALRIWMERGTAFDLRGVEAETLRRHLASVTRPHAADGGAAQAGHSVPVDNGGAMQGGLSVGD